MAGAVELLEAIEEVADEQGMVIGLRERLAEIELAIEDQGWTRLSAVADKEFSRAGIRSSVKIARLMYLSNPIIRNGVNVQANYVWGQGVNIRARATVVNGVVQAFLDHPANRREFSGHMARLFKEVQLQLSSNLFFALFTDPSTGFVKTRSIDVDEIQDIYTNPDDANEPWYYLRNWHQTSIDDLGNVLPLSTSASAKQVLYPNWLHPQLRDVGRRPRQLKDIEIQWDAPVYHLKTGGLDHMRFGVPEIFASLDWARAVKQDLEDYATIRKALTRFAWMMTRKGGKNAVAAATKRLNSTLSSGLDVESNPPAATGSTFVKGEGVDMQPIKTSGMAPSPDEGRRLWLMVGAGMGIPETMLSGDATVGNYATAKSLDRPTELKMRNRQTMWQGVITDILGYVIDSAALATSGPLKGKLVADKYSGEQTVVVGPSKNPTDRRLDVDFPDILERDALSRVQAIVTGATTNGQASAGTLRPETVTRLLLNALGEDDIDEELAKMDFTGDPNPPAPDPGQVTSETVKTLVDAMVSAGAFSQANTAKLHEALVKIAERAVKVDVQLPEPKPVKRETRFKLEERDGIKNVIVGKDEIEMPVDGGKE